MAARKFGMHSLHVKKNTVGSSNELSFSVLDAKKQRQDAGNEPKRGNPLGKIALFSLPGTKKIKGAPKREEGLPLSNGDFAPSSVEHDPMGTVSLGSNAISGGSASSGYVDDFSGSVATSHGKTSRRGREKSSDATTSHAAPAEEKEKRRRLSRRAGVITIACLVIAVVAFGVYSLARGYHEGYVLNQSYQQVITSSLAEVVEADEVLSEMDASFSDMLSQESLTEMKKVQGKVSTAQQHLNNAETLVKRVQGSLSDEKDIRAAKNTLDAIAIRRSMITLGTSMIEETLKVSQERSKLTEIWDDLLAADALARQAVSAYSPLDADSLTQAKDDAKQARDAFNQTANQLTELMKTYPDLTLSTYTEYVQLRVEALDHLIASCEAIEVEDVDLATTENDAYNVCDGKAVAQANEFPSDIATLATDPYFQKVESFKSEYSALLATASTLDSELREYLRVTSS